MAIGVSRDRGGAVTRSVTVATVAEEQTTRPVPSDVYAAHNEEIKALKKRLERQDMEICVMGCVMAVGFAALLIFERLRDRY